MKLVKSLVALCAVAFALTSCCCDRNPCCDPCPRPCPKPMCPKPVCPKPAPCCPDGGYGY
ncbi:MAG TPA: hypothetical protein PLC42_08065 [Parachlamydiaceae bacterium]|nr:hypothetical protein [Parachlamydiaceae bacterium]